jgi:hypothetical protein
MSKLGHVSQAPPPQDRKGVASTRRTFFRRVLGGLAIALPAYGVLSGAGPALSAVNPQACSAGCPAPCSKVYLVYEGHHCSGFGLPGSCAGPAISHCIGVYHKYDSTTGQYCGQITDDEGYCT